MVEDYGEQFGIMARYYHLKPSDVGELTWDQYHMLIDKKEKVAKNLGETDRGPSKPMTKTAAPMKG